MTLKDVIASRILQLCEERHLTPYSLAMLCGLDKTTVYSIIGDKSKSPEVATIKKICDAWTYHIAQPIEVRHALDWNTETPLDIYCDTDTGEVRLKAHENHCIYCGTTQDLLKFQNRYICCACQKKIAELSAK